MCEREGEPGRVSYRDRRVGGGLGREEGVGGVVVRLLRKKSLGLVESMELGSAGARGKNLRSRAGGPRRWRQRRRQRRKAIASLEEGLGSVGPSAKGSLDRQARHARACAQQEVRHGGLAHGSGDATLSTPTGAASSKHEARCSRAHNEACEEAEVSLLRMQCT